MTGNAHAAKLVRGNIVPVCTERSAYAALVTDEHATCPACRAIIAKRADATTPRTEVHSNG
jgi:hypothetical protein